MPGCPGVRLGAHVACGRGPQPPPAVGVAGPAPPCALCPRTSALRALTGTRQAHSTLTGEPLRLQGEPATTAAALALVAWAGQDPPTCLTCHPASSPPPPRPTSARRGSVPRGRRDRPDSASPDAEGAAGLGPGPDPDPPGRGNLVPRHARARPAWLRAATQSGPCAPRLSPGVPSAHCWRLPGRGARTATSPLRTVGAPAGAWVGGQLEAQAGGGRPPLCPPSGHTVVSPPLAPGWASSPSWARRGTRGLEGPAARGAHPSGLCRGSGAQRGG